jgi:phosphatidate phosphatase APP1
MKLNLPELDRRVIQAPVQLIGESGLSIISDIDDTIKLSHVANRRELMRNTFLREFTPISGMVDLYRYWESQGAVFHYVSSSPWQLFDSLTEFLSRHSFPVGSMHLRSVRFRDPLIRLFVARRRSKLRTIRSIVRLFSHRQFILVGDSGERDMEIYGSIARRFPAQVHRILIRRAEGLAITAQRLARAFRGVPSAKWTFFSDGLELLNGRIS